MVGIMHEWVLDPSAYDLDSAAPALIDYLPRGPSPSAAAAHAPAAAAAERSPCARNVRSHASSGGRWVWAASVGMFQSSNCRRPARSITVIPP